MPPFPYLDILKAAAAISRKNVWLWIFGLFIGGWGGMNLGSANFAARFGAEDARVMLQNINLWLNQNPKLFPAVAAGMLAVSLIVLVFKIVSLGSIIWAVRELTKKQKPAKVNFKTAVHESRNYFWRILAVEIFLSLAFFILLAVLLLPILYLFSIPAVGRGIVLSLIGLLIFIPASVVFVFVRLYTPIIVVLYERNLKDGLALAFNLLRRKLKESVILAAFLVGLSLLFFLLVGFSIILLTLPLAMLGLFLAWLGFGAAVNTLIIGGGVGIVLYLIGVSAGFAVFRKTAWVLAVKELIKTKKIREEKPALAIEGAT